MPDMLIDVSRLVGRRLKGRLPTGIDRVGQAYVRRYRESARAVLSVGSRPVVLPRQESRRLFDHLLTPADQGAFLRTLVAGAMHAAVPRPSGAGRTAGAWFLNTGHTGLHRPGYLRMLSAMQVRPLFVVHDLIPITHPQYCRAPEQARHVARMTAVLRGASAVVCNSTATLEGLAGFGQTIAMPLPPAAVAPLAADPIDPSRLAAARLQPPPATPYFLMLGTIEPRKNHLMLLQVWQRLIERLGQRAPMLLLIGQRGWECEHVERMLARTPGLQERVRLLERCDDDQLLGWMLHARALLLPSFAEGFGLPVVEALRVGVPVIASDSTVFREFAGSIPEYLDPLDAAGWQAAIVDYCRDAGEPGGRRRARRVEMARAFREPTWDDHFARVERLMAQVEMRAAIQVEMQAGIQAEAQADRRSEPALDASGERHDVRPSSAAGAQPLGCVAGCSDG